MKRLLNDAGRTQKMLFPCTEPVPETSGSFRGIPGHGVSIPVNGIGESSPAVLGCIILDAACVLAMEKPMLVLWVEDAMWAAGTFKTVFWGAGERALE